MLIPENKLLRPKTNGISVGDKFNLKLNKNFEFNLPPTEELQKTENKIKEISNKKIPKNTNSLF